MWKTILTIIGVVIFLLIAENFLRKNDTYNLKLEKLKQEYAVKPISSVDHSKLAVLQKAFASPQEVTEACLTCHTETHKEIMNSAHWNWERVSYIEGRGVASVGKKNVLNNFCIGASSNEQACAKCHIGFGMSNDHFDFNNARNVDCMVCHDNSKEYQKGAAMAGYPDRSVNLSKVAQHVGRPENINCGGCHFYSGGGNNVKHGDLEESLMACTRETDVHMASNGMNLSCVDCHTAENHQIKGKLYSVSSTNENRANCTDCHTSTPHHEKRLNTHFATVSCQACHIPFYAKENATKMTWHWSEAGKLKDGEPYEEKDSSGNVCYMSKKGAFTWKQHVVPDYRWFNGTAGHYLLGDTIASSPVEINTLYGSHDDGKSKIVPVKIHYGDQIYDTKLKTLVQPKLYAKHHGDSAYWKDFDWKTAAEAGMNRMGMPFSGEYGFVETEMYWPINHMVSPASEALSCSDCHTRNNGRLAKLEGFYLPGRDKNNWLDFGGKFLIIFSLIGVIAHATIRVITAAKNGEIQDETIDFEDKTM